MAVHVSQHMCGEQRTALWTLFLFPHLYLLNKLSTVDPNTPAQVTVSGAMPGAQNKGAEACRNPGFVSRADHTYLFKPALLLFFCQVFSLYPRRVLKALIMRSVNDRSNLGVSVFKCKKENHPYIWRDDNNRNEDLRHSPVGQNVICKSIHGREDIS